MQEHWFQPLGTSSSWNCKHTVPRLGSMDSNDQWFQDLEASVPMFGNRQFLELGTCARMASDSWGSQFFNTLEARGGAKASRAGVGC